jgi:ABC-2 type transport system permease protein
VNANQFINGGQDMGLAGQDAAGPAGMLSPWWALAYFAALGIGLLVIALAVASKRDA